MKLVSKNILEFLDEHCGLYKNPHGVEFSLLSDNSICFAAAWPGTEGTECYDLGFTFETDKVDTLVSILQISTLQQLRSLTPSFLLTLYHQGKVVVNCIFEKEREYYTLDFFKIGRNAYAVGADGEGYFVSDPLEKPEDFYNYLRKHGRLN
jgi:hypothetical protein